MSYRSTSILVLLLFSLFHCKTSEYEPEALPERQLLFGNGGGFTGEVKAYILLENGQLFHRLKVDGPLTALKKVKSKKAAKLMERADQLQLENYALKQPGNIYQFLEWKGQRLVWGATGVEVPTEVETLYQDLIGLIKVAD